MKRYALTALLSLSAFVATAQNAPDSIFPAPYTISENQELPRSVFVSYRSVREALRNDFDSSQNFINLNGEWACRMFGSESAVPAEVYREGFEGAGWPKATLPGPWQLHGHGATGDAVFTEGSYFFAPVRPTPPALPGESPVMVYARRFTVPFDLFDKAHFLHIGAANAGAKVYINGHEIGYSIKDSKNPVELDVTNYVTDGRNNIVILVPQFTAASYMESQPGWHLSGINRDIFIFAQPKIRIRDFLVRTTLDPSYNNGLLETALLLKTQLLNPHTVTVHYELYDPQGNLVNKNSKDAHLGMRTEDTVRFTASIPRVQKWNAETPQLYTILYRIQREGRYTEYAACRVGFRTVEVRDDQLLLNGRPLVIKGVNLAEHDPQTGNYLSSQQMREMLTGIKLSGMNAVRTDGYPLPGSFYDICDEIGLYVCDVANINTMAQGTSRSRGRNISNNPVWREAYLERIDAMYERNKNHASVIMWALGDRASNGYNMYQGYLMLQAKESTRPIVYDGAGMEWNTDIYCPTYPESAENPSGRPFIPSRVAFDPVYWAGDAQGAFLDTWNDLSLSASVGGQKYLLDKDYQKQNVSGRMSGTTVRDRVEQAEDIFPHVLVTAVDPSKGVFEFTNRLYFTDLEQIPISYRITNGNKVVREGILTVAAAPGKSNTVSVPGAGSSILRGRGGNRQLTIRIGDLAEYVY